MQYNWLIVAWLKLAASISLLFGMTKLGSDISEDDVANVVANINYRKSFKVCAVHLSNQCYPQIIFW